MRFLGVDLAWAGEKNPSAVAVGKLKGNQLFLEAIEPAIIGLSAITNYVLRTPNLKGIAIDAPLIINNLSGQRQCESALSKDYASKKASCHAANLGLYPDAFSVKFADILLQNGHEHISGEKWQIECYPHPALIEIFSLEERMLYKKGSVADKKAGQVLLSEHLKKLASSPVLKLNIPSELSVYLEVEHISRLKGKALKSNEDALDAIICLYIATLHGMSAKGKLYGEAANGYIWVPTLPCI